MVTAVEYERGSGFVQFGEPFFQSSVHGEIAGQQPRRCRGETNVTGIQVLQKLLFQVCVIGQSQIIVRGEIQHGVPVTDDGQSLCIHGRQGSQITLSRELFQLGRIGIHYRSVFTTSNRAEVSVES